MTTIAYCDCFSGASGDMLLGALLDAGCDEAALRAALATLPLRDWELRVQPTQQHGQRGARVDVVVLAEQPSRHLRDIRAVVQASGLTTAQQSRAIAVFERLAAAEARVHGVGLEEVHFHEVGAVDAIVDVVGVVVALDLLGVKQLYASALPTGHGRIRSAHGELPIPAPATLELLAAVGAPLRPLDIEAELVTPTGAALLATLARFEQPPLRLERVGVGFGRRQLPWPNLLRLWLGTAEAPTLASDRVVVLETSIDDATPEQLAHAMERLFAAGALDVYFTPISMKKSRPATLVSVIATPPSARWLAGVLLAETGSLGARQREVERWVLPRRQERVQTRFGELRVKVRAVDGREVATPEYEDCARAAREAGVPLVEVYSAVLAAWELLSRRSSQR